jgi:Zn-dependent protease with chaperone function
MSAVLRETRIDDSWARLRLAVSAVGGIAAYHVVLVAPFAALLLLNPWTRYYGVWPALAGVALVWWTLHPWREAVGRPVSRRDAPGLFDAVDLLADRIGAPRIHEVRLTDDFNAAAQVVDVRWQPWRKRRVLVLGVPLLALLDVDAVRGVIAHELGHFSHRHGRLGHWIYRARAGWTAYAQTPVEDAPLLERGAAFFARWFAPRFSRLSFAYSRRCEYEADAFGAAVVGTESMALALFAVEAFDGRWRAMLDEALPQLIAEREQPPEAWLAHVQQAVHRQPPQADEWHRLRARASAENDTHPSLGERVDALGVSGEALLAAATLPAQPAGVAWFADWPAIAARHDAGWRASHEGLWRQQHVRHKHQRRRLEQLRAADDLTLERAGLEFEHGEPAQAAALARRWVDDAALGAHAAYLVGAAQLRSGDAAGIATLEACIARAPAWAAPARAAIERHASLVADAALRERNRALLDKALRRRAHALGRLHWMTSRAELRPAMLDDSTDALLRAALSTVPTVAAAWCATVPGFEQDGRHFETFVLLLRLRTDRLREADLDEDDLIGDMQALLSQLLPPSALRLVWTAYTTEGLAPAVHALLQGWVEAGDRACLVKPVEGEAAGPAVRASALG